MVAGSRGSGYTAMVEANQRERISLAIANRAWVGRTRRVGLSYWESNGDLPLFSAGPQGIQNQVYRCRGTNLMWVRIPFTTWCLTTYRRTP